MHCIQHDFIRQHLGLSKGQTSTFKSFVINQSYYLSYYLSSYNSHKNNIGTHLQIIGKTLDILSKSYDNIILIGDFDGEPEEAKKMSEFLNMYSLKNLVSQNTCSKNPENPSCIDLILRNCSRSF